MDWKVLIECTDSMEVESLQLSSSLNAQGQEEVAVKENNAFKMTVTFLA